jgi:hypothetical protein
MTKKKKTNKASKMAKTDSFIDYNNMTYKDLKKACIIRGLEFEKVASSDIYKLQSWLHNNLGNPEYQDLLEQYDDWVEEQLLALGSNDLIHPMLRLSYIGEREEQQKIKPKREKVERVPRQRKEKTEQGIYSGTKKALVYECALKEMNIQNTLKKVKKVFGDNVSEKSVKIWFKKALKENMK